MVYRRVHSPPTQPPYTAPITQPYQQYFLLLGLSDRLLYTPKLAVYCVSVEIPFGIKSQYVKVTAPEHWVHSPPTQPPYTAPPGLYTYTAPQPKGGGWSPVLIKPLFVHGGEGIPPYRSRGHWWPKKDCEAGRDADAAGSRDTVSYLIVETILRSLNEWPTAHSHRGGPRNRSTE